MSEMMERILQRLLLTRVRVRKGLQRVWYRARKAVYSTIWGERLWFDYPPERWWDWHDYTIKWRLTQLRNSVFALSVTTAVVVSLWVGLAGIHLYETPATAWVKFDEGEATLEVWFKNSLTKNHTRAAFLYCTVRSVSEGGMPTTEYSYADVRGLRFGYFRFPVPTRMGRIVNISISMEMADGRRVTIIPGLNLAVGEDGWEVYFPPQK